MKWTVAAVGFAAAVSAQGVTQQIAPPTKAPANCSPDFDGTFEYAVGNPQTQKRGLESRDACGTNALVVSLKGGVLTDSKGRTGYIAANRQFQFDKPAQTGAIYTAGFSICTNSAGSYLALGDQTTFFRCLSGNFYNLYDKNNAKQCEQVSLLTFGCGSGSGSTGGSAPAGSSGSGPAVSQIGDGQPQAPSDIVTVIGDGQPQAPTGIVTQIGDGQPQAPTGVVTQIGDANQPQAPTGVVTQIGDGQPQAPTGVVTQIGDGQPQAPTGIVTQIGDGQPQAPTGTPVAVGPNAGNKVIPGTFAALFVGLVGTVLYL